MCVAALQKAAVRACRNAIEFNSIPCIQQIVPNGYAGMQIHVKIGVPDPVPLRPCVHCPVILFLVLHSSEGRG